MPMPMAKNGGRKGKGKKGKSPKKGGGKMEESGKKEGRQTQLAKKGKRRGVEGPKKCGRNIHTLLLLLFLLLLGAQTGDGANADIEQKSLDIKGWGNAGRCHWRTDKDEDARERTHTYENI
jgi:hypothetical protein